MTDLNKIRIRIDETDAGLLRAFEERMQLSREVGQFKIETGKPVYDKKREEEKLSALTALTRKEEDQSYVHDFFSSVMAISRNCQYEMMQTVPAGNPKDCIFYTLSKEFFLIENMYALITFEKQDPPDPSVYKNLLFSVFRHLADYGERLHLSGNLWQIFLTHFLICHENPFSLSCEYKKQPSESLMTAARHDLSIFYSLFFYEIRTINTASCPGLLEQICSYTCSPCKGTTENSAFTETLTRISHILASSGSPEEFMEHLIRFYHCSGTGRFALHPIFRFCPDREGSGNCLLPVETSEEEMPCLPEGLLHNTAAFVKNRPADDLLFSGCTPSYNAAVIRYLSGSFAAEKLRVIEINETHISQICLLLDLIKNRNYKFIFYADLSFSLHPDTIFARLKAATEKDLAQRPENFLLYASTDKTS